MSNLTDTREIIIYCAGCGEPIVFDPEYTDWVSRSENRAAHYVNVCAGAADTGHAPENYWAY